jgi:hypothetical protein
MDYEWGNWEANSECVELHGLTPSFARAIAGQVDRRFEDAFLNVRPDPLDLRDRYYQAPLVALQTRLCPPELESLDILVRNQGAEGSCTGQALAAVIDLQNAPRRLNASEDDRNLPIPVQVSARMLYDMARSHDEYADDGLPGSSVRGAIKGFFHNGVCDSVSAPYFAGDVDWRLTADMGREARNTSLGAYYRLRHVINDYHAALNEVGAVLCSAMIHNGWNEAEVASKPGRIDLASDRTVELVGAHAFALVGYDRDGFYVLNSWGPSWGGIEAVGANGRRTARPGIAHWSYEDWQKHVLDAWVLRLSAPSAKSFGLIGGYVRPQARLTVPSALERVEVLRPEPSVSRQRILGHYIHLNDGRFVTTGAYPSSPGSIAETAVHLNRVDGEDDPEKRYDRILFYAHGGLNSLDDAAARMAAMTPGFKRNGVYPIFFLWRTGLFETVGDVLGGAAQRALLRTGGAEDFMNRLIEEAAQRIGRPIWSDMKLDAERAFVTGPAAGRVALQLVGEALAARVRHPASIHFVGHSAGAILLGRLFEQLDPAIRALTGTVSLMASACSTSFFDEKLEPIAAALANSPSRCAHFVLPDSAERRDRVAIYRRSLLYLISNGLEGRREVPIAGMETFWGKRRRWTTHVSHGSSPFSRASTHGGFDNDPFTMNTILSRVCARPVDEGNGGFTLAELNG